MDFATAYDPFRALQTAWALLKKAPATVLVGGALLSITGGGGGAGGRFELDANQHYSGAEAAMAVALFLGLLVLAIGFWLFACLLRTGFPTAIEGVHRSGSEELAAVFKSEGRWLNMVAATFLQGLALVAAVVPMFLIVLLAVLMGRGAENPPLGVGIGLVGLVVWLPFFLYVWLGLSLIPMAVSVERLSPIAAFSRSWELVRGNRLQLLLFYLLTFVFAALGLLACCIGVLLTGAMAQAAHADAYLRLVRPPEDQAAWVS